MQPLDYSGFASFQFHKGTIRTLFRSYVAEANNTISIP